MVRFNFIPIRILILSEGRVFVPSLYDLKICPSDLRKKSKWDRFVSSSTPLKIAGKGLEKYTFCNWFLRVSINLGPVM